MVISITRQSYNLYQQMACCYQDSKTPQYNKDEAND